MVSTKGEIRNVRLRPETVKRLKEAAADRFISLTALLSQIVEDQASRIVGTVPDADKLDQIWRAVCKTKA